MSLALLTFTVNAQQEAQFSQNRFLNPVFNPGAVGIKTSMHCFDFIARQQWIGFEGAPSTALLSYNGSFPQQNIGLGGVFVYDQIGLEQNVFFKVNGAYHLNVGGGKLGIGLDLGVMSKQISGTITAVDPTDPNIVGLSGQSSLNFDLGVGVFYYKERQYYFGISGQKLIPQKITWGSAQPTIRPHSYLMGGYYQRLNADFYLIPSMLVKTDLTATQIDINVNLEYQQFLWGGFSYRYQDAVVAMLGYQTSMGPKNGVAKFGIAYDFTTQNLRNDGVFEGSGAASERKDSNRSYGAAELYIGYCFIQPTPPNFPHYVDPLLPFDLR